MAVFDSTPIMFFPVNLIDYTKGLIAKTAEFNLVNISQFALPFPFIIY